MRDRGGIAVFYRRPNGRHAAQMSGEKNVANLAVSKKTLTKWNSSTFYGTVPQFVEQRPKNVEQLPKK